MIFMRQRTKICFVFHHDIGKYPYFLTKCVESWRPIGDQLGGIAYLSQLRGIYIVYNDAGRGKKEDGTLKPYLLKSSYTSSVFYLAYPGDFFR